MLPIPSDATTHCYFQDFQIAFSDPAPIRVALGPANLLCSQMLRQLQAGVSLLHSNSSALSCPGPWVTFRATHRGPAGALSPIPLSTQSSGCGSQAYRRPEQIAGFQRCSCKVLLGEGAEGSTLNVCHVVDSLWLGAFVLWCARLRSPNIFGLNWRHKIRLCGNLKKEGVEVQL